MAVPVQTWGSLSTMLAEQREFGAKTAEYLEANEVYDLFGQLLRKVIVHQPENPIKFLQEQLKAKPPLSMCVMGPPGIGRTGYCQKLASEFGLKHIHVGKTLRADKNLIDQLKNGELIDDSLVIKLIKAEIASEAKSAATNGYVLDGFPRTKVQAQILAQKELNFSLDNVILLNAPEKAIRQSLAAKLAAGAVTADKEELINVRLQQYQRHIIGIAEMFKNIIRQIQVTVGDDDQGLTWNTIKSNIHMRPYSNAPMRPHRICIVGPCGSGRTTQARAVAKTYGLVHVDIAVLIRKWQQETGQPIEDVPPEYLSDEMLCAAVGRRMNETDCIRKGWVLDGFPKTQSQAEFLRQSHLWPSRIIDLQADLQAVIARISSRRIDPETCTAYYRSPNSVAIRQRLLQAPHDQAAAVEERFKTYRENVDRSLQTFPMVNTSILGGAEAGEVTKKILKFIDEPLHSELAQGDRES